MQKQKAAARESSNVGRFLYAMRINSGYENIADYLRKYQLPISNNYYRDVEAGRKRLSLEMAMELTRCLPIPPDGAEEFIWHFLRDALPADLQTKLLIPRVDKAFSKQKEARDLIQRDLQMYRAAEALRQVEENYISDDRVYGTLADNIEYLPIVHHVYMAEATTDAKIRAICDVEKIPFDVDLICKTLADCGVEIEKNENEIIFRRAKPVFRVARTSAGQRLIEAFIEFELAKSKAKPPASKIFDRADSTFETSKIISVSSRRAAILQERLQDFLTETVLAKDKLDTTDAEPYFVMCVVSARPEYNPGISRAKATRKHRPVKHSSLTEQ